MSDPAIFQPCDMCKGTGVQPGSTPPYRCRKCLGKKTMLTPFGDDLRDFIREIVDDMKFAHTWDLRE